MEVITGLSKLSRRTSLRAISLDISLLLMIEMKGGIENWEVPFAGCGYFERAVGLGKNSNLLCTTNKGIFFGSVSSILLDH